MKHHIRRFGIPLLLLPGALAWAGPAAPDGYPVSRYASLWERSPFTIASVRQDVVPEGFASKLVLAGVARIGADDFAILVNKDSQERINVSSEPNGQGMKLLSVEPNADPLKACVTIQKGVEVAVVRYDQALLVATTAPAPDNVAVTQPTAVPPNRRQFLPPPNPPVSRARRAASANFQYPTGPVSRGTSSNISPAH